MCTLLPLFLHLIIRLSPCVWLQYGIKKREEKEEEMRKQQEALMKGINPTEAGGLNRAKKTPEELAAEAAAQDQDEFTSK